jgi:hypothetical protein
MTLNSVYTKIRTPSRAAATQGCDAIACIRSPRHSNLDDTGHYRISKHVDCLKILLLVRFVHNYSFGVV